MLTNTEACSNRESLRRQLKKVLESEKMVQTLLRGPTTRKDMRRNVLNGTANWRTKTIEQLYEVSTLCLDDHQCKKIGDGWRNVHSVLSYSPEMLVFGTHVWTRHPLVGQNWHGTFDLLHSSHM